MKTRYIFRKFKVTKEEKTFTEILRVKINNEIPPTHKNFQSC